MWFNALQRRISRGNLAPGLVEKYQNISGPQKFEMLKAFMIDPDMKLGSICFEFFN